MEAHGTGTKAGDPQELNALTDIFCGPSRTSPLLIGSVKSNMGHAEPASSKDFHVLTLMFTFMYFKKSKRINGFSFVQFKLLQCSGIVSS